ncbi:MAG: hypothetical protein ABL940_01575 [Bacteroidia bacterium]
MKPHSISLTIDNPCTQNWDGMIVNDNGKFCISCNKNVIDFSTLSDAEIIKLLSHTTSNVCGRLNSQQLNRVIHPKAEIQSGLNKFWLSFSLTALLSNLGIVKATAQTSTKTEQLPTNNVSAKQPLSVNDSAVTKIKCVLLDSITHEPLAYAKVEIDELKIIGNTDTNGVFEFIKPINIKSENVNIRVSSIAYYPTLINVNLINKTFFKIMVPRESMLINMMGSVCLTVKGEDKPTLWQRIKYKFSRK